VYQAATIKGDAAMPRKPKSLYPTRRSRKLPKYEWDADKVKALREFLELSQTQFAEELGTLQQTVSYWECGNHFPKGMSVKILNLVAEKAKFKYEAKPKKTED
jgi:DNA-binding transcriptional regulator YiaG